MIRRDQVIDLLLEACPSYRPRWEAHRAEPDHEAELLYVHLGDFAHHVVDLLARGDTTELPAIARALEQLHLAGDDHVRQAATIGLVEGIQNVASHQAGLTTKPLEEILGPETRRWWNSLQAFWAGAIPHVGADIAKG
jgi:hypothetical protein